MNPRGAPGGWAGTPVRRRLTLALVLGLAPVLIVGALQSYIASNREARQSQSELAAAAERSAATARARIEAAEILLQTLAPGSVGFQCAARLAEIKNRIPGYDNLIRFDPEGRVACSAAGAPADPDRAQRPWFAALAQWATAASRHCHNGDLKNSSLVASGKFDSQATDNKQAFATLWNQLAHKDGLPTYTVDQL